MSTILLSHVWFQTELNSTQFHSKKYFKKKVFYVNCYFCMCGKNNNFLDGALNAHISSKNHTIIQLLFIVLSVVTPFVSGMIERDFVPPPPYSLQTCAIAELSSSILTNEPQASGRASVWPLKYWTTASPVLLAAVVKWNVRPCCLLQKNRSWVKDTLDLSSFIVLLRRTMFPLL